MENQELKTAVIASGEKMIVGEPVNYCGLQDFNEVTRFQKGLIFLLRRFVNEELSDGGGWCDNITSSVCTMFDVLEDVTDYKHAYLVRRIEQLEKANGLHHYGDIDID